MDPPLSRGEERSLKTVVDQSWIRHPRHLPPPPDKCTLFSLNFTTFREIAIRNWRSTRAAGVTISHYGPQ